MQASSRIAAVYGQPRPDHTSGTFRSFLLDHSPDSGGLETLKFEEDGNLRFQHEMLEVRDRTASEMIVRK